jgi:hypothetical protein
MSYIVNQDDIKTINSGENNIIYPINVKYINKITTKQHHGYIIMLDNEYHLFCDLVLQLILSYYVVDNNVRLDYIKTKYRCYIKYNNIFSININVLRTVR